MADKETQQENPARGKFRTMCGGQALIEGIMMRGPRKQAIVVRRPDGGLERKIDDLILIRERYPVLGLPIIRGVVNFFASLVEGVKALMFSAEFYPEDEEDSSEPSKFDQWLEAHFTDEKITKIVSGIGVTLGVVLAVALFLVLPTLLGTLVKLFTDSLLVRNLAENILRIAIFLFYMYLMSRMKDMDRLFRYHGAEHQTIFCYEAGLPLTVENVRRMPRHHPRCGTSFLFNVIVIAIIISCIVFSLLQISNVGMRILAHLALLPVIIGLTYELNRYVGGHDNRFTKIMTAPGLALQNWTTKEPDDGMIEVGIAALQEVLPEEKGDDDWLR